MKIKSLLAYTSLMTLAALGCAAQNLPDFVPASLGWNVPPVAGQPVTLSMVVSNLGNGAASGGWYDKFVLSTTTNVADSVGTYESYYCCYNAPTNGYYVASTGVTLPGVPPGNYYLIGVADDRNYVPESNETNNTLAVPITIATPDFVPASLGWNMPPVAGQPVTVSMVVSNLGNGAASGGWYDKFVLSTTTNVADAVGTYESYYCCYTAPTNGTYVASTGITLPAVPPGNYYLIGVADDRNYVYESNENNNMLAVPIKIAAPDFVPASLGWSGPPVAGQPVTLSMVVSNLGNGAASGGWYDKFVVSTTTNVADSVGSFESYYCCYNAPTNGYYVASTGVTLPGVPPGNYYLIGVADDRNYVFESNENNNTLAVPIKIAAPDFVPASLGWNVPLVAGQGVTLSMVVTNLGNGAASGGWYDKFVLSTTTNVANAVANGTFESYYCCYNAPTNGYYVAATGVTLPAVPAGNYYLIGMADDRNYVYESNETNNTLVIAMTIGNTDLIATNFSYIAPAVAGTNLPVSFSVNNNGTNAYSSYWYDSVSLSNAAQGIVISNWEFYGYHSLASGGSYVQSQLIPLPGVAAGTNYYLIAQADDRNYVPEINKTNNFQVLQVTITNRPPAIALLTPTNTVQQTSCVPVSLLLSVGIQLGSYAITNVTFYDGSTPIAQTTTAPYRVKSVPLDHGSHVITVQALDQFGLLGTSVVTSTVSIFWPGQTNVLRADVFSNTCVICMAALNGTNYVIEAKTNLSSPAWLPIGTNQVNGAMLVFTNQQTVPARFYRTQY